MKNFSGTLTIDSHQTMEMINITDQVRQCLQKSGVISGSLYLYNPHTTSGLTINEGADPDVQHDLMGALQQIIPAQYPYRHAEGNSPAHLMTTLVGSSLTLIIDQGQLCLGTWQQLFFCEFDGPRSRQIRWKIIAD